MRARLARVETGPPAPWTLEEACALLAVVWRELGVLRAENAALRTRVEALEARLAQDSSNSSRPPSSDPPGTPPRRPPPSGRARGGQPGHAAHVRLLVPPEEVDRFVEHYPATCGR